MTDQVSHDDMSSGTAARPMPVPRYVLRPWKRIALGAAGVMLVTGLLIEGVGLVTGSSVARGNPSKNVPPDGGGGAAALTPERVLPGAGSSGEQPRSAPGGDREAPQSELSDWSPTLLKGGAGFLFGFCIGFALRSFYRIASVVFGIVVLLLFALQYAGWIEVRWEETIYPQLDSWWTALKTELTQFKAFVAGKLPAAGMTGLGAFTGFRKS